MAFYVMLKFVVALALPLNYYVMSEPAILIFTAITECCRYYWCQKLDIPLFLLPATEYCDCIIGGRGQSRNHCSTCWKDIFFSFDHKSDNNDKL